MSQEQKDSRSKIAILIGTKTTFGAIALLVMSVIGGFVSVGVTLLICGFISVYTGVPINTTQYCLVFLTLWSVVAAVIALLFMSLK